VILGLTCFVDGGTGFPMQNKKLLRLYFTRWRYEREVALSAPVSSVGRLNRVGGEGALMQQTE